MAVRYFINQKQAKAMPLRMRKILGEYIRVCLQNVIFMSGTCEVPPALVPKIAQAKRGGGLFRWDVLLSDYH